MKDTTLKFVYPNGSMQEMVQRLLTQMGVFALDDSGVLAPNSQIDLGPGIIPIANVSTFRSQDIPVLLESGAFDLGIVGHDWLLEREVDVMEISQFALSRNTFTPIRLVLAAPQELGCQSVESLPNSAIIATEYPSIARRYLAGKSRSDTIIQLSYGQTELKPRIGAATAVIDITETGNSLRANGLEIIEVICESVMTVSANKSAYRNDKKRKAINNFAQIVQDSYRLMLIDERRKQNDNQHQVISGQ